MFDIKYIAGIFDGEGSVTINARKRGPHGIQYNLVLSISNTDEDLIKGIKNFFGKGSVFSSKEVKCNHKVYSYHVSNKSAYEVCLLLKDHVFVKLEQVQLAIEFQENCIGWLRPWGNSKKLPEKRKQYESMCSEYKNRMSKLKHVYTGRKKLLQKLKRSV